MEIEINSRKYGIHKVIIDEKNLYLIKDKILTLHKADKTKYETLYCYIRDGNKTYKLHRLIMGVSDPKILIDHIDHNGLNNLESNLRCCSNFENTKNSRKPLSCTNGLPKGVEKLKNGNYLAYIKFNYKKIHIGTFLTDKDAGLAYDEAARYLFKEFACLNFPNEISALVDLKNIDYKLSTKTKERTRSKYSGIYLHKTSGLWHACITVNKKKISIGYYKTEIESAKAVDDFVIKNNIERKLNFSEDYQ